MPSYGQTVTLQYVAWNTSTNAGQTGDSANHTLRWVKDGVEDTSILPTGTEIDSANCPGVYKAAITATQAQCQVGTLCGKSGTSNVVLLPLTVTFENLPTALPAASGGLPTIGTGSGQINPSNGGVDVQTIKAQSVTASGPIVFSTNVGSAYPLSVSSTGQAGLDFTNIKQATSSTTLSNITIPAVTNVANVTGNVAGSVGSVTGLTTTTIAAAILATPSQLLQTDSAGRALVSLTQAIPPTGNTANSLADCLNAARAQGFGKWVLSGTTLTLYAADGATTVRTFTLDSASAPTQRY